MGGASGGVEFVGLVLMPWPPYTDQLIGRSLTLAGGGLLAVKGLLAVSWQSRAAVAEEERFTGLLFLLGIRVAKGTTTSYIDGPGHPAVGGLWESGCGAGALLLVRLCAKAHIHHLSPDCEAAMVVRGDLSGSSIQQNAHLNLQSRRW